MTAADKSNILKLNVSELKLGMFVTAIETGTQVRMKNDGLITNTQVIDKLRSSGVHFAWVDTDRSDASCFPNRESDPSSSRTVKNKRAKKLISEARGLANKILHDTFDGKSIDLDELDDWADGVIDTIIEDSDAFKFVSMLRSKDTYLLEHSVNVACLLVTFGQFLKLDRSVLKYLAIGGMLHDIGKIKVKSEVLNKPGSLLPEEFEHIKLHQTFLHELLYKQGDIHEISRMVCMMHHEKLDGSGYPFGLTAKDIPLYGRMSSIIDIYDALTAERCYKNGLPPSTAFKILLEMVPDKLDQDLVYKFINCIGIYPEGSLVELSNGMVGLVQSYNKAQPQKPDVKCFYSTETGQVFDETVVRLESTELTIRSAVAPAAMNFDISRYFV